MPISDEELVRQLEAVPLVEPPDFREAVMAKISRSSGHPGAAVLHFKPRLYLGLAWAAAVAIVIGVAFFKASPPQNTSATMTTSAPELVVSQSGDRWIVQPSVEGRLEWDQSKLVKVDTLPDGSVVFQRVEGATGSAEVRLRVAGREVAKTSISLE